ncbi:hypothetical protein [Lacicoccus qingdaonensis]|uniref:Uncharacterized protein n=1 Tax=Lacicoccus qingdaonensis TaxID=576118 RepID=A0A1G9B1S7_9BACL|nr:hypothetical protein [Salinicoccus qingdaonensis]SDK33556.1 hypothetical protein SAMN05216216_10286 [Salinicoccus qingdaonensis]
MKLKGDETVKYFLLSILLSIELTGCTAVGQSGVEEMDVNELDNELKEYIETEEVNNIMHVEAEDGNSDYVVFYAPGATELTAEETDDGFLDIKMDKPDDAQDEILHVYELSIGNDIETLRYYINDTETHVEALIK